MGYSHLILYCFRCSRIMNYYDLNVGRPRPSFLELLNGWCQFSWENLMPSVGNLDTLQSNCLNFLFLQWWVIGTWKDIFEATKIKLQILLSSSIWSSPWLDCFCHRCCFRTNIFVSFSKYAHKCFRQKRSFCITYPNCNLEDHICYSWSNFIDHKKSTKHMYFTKFPWCVKAIKEQNRWCLFLTTQRSQTF